MRAEAPASRPEDFFAGFPAGLAVFRAVDRAVASLGPAQVSVTRSQIAFRRRRGFAFVWRPGQYVRSDVPAVLSIALSRPLGSDRFKSVVQVGPHRWMHHLEVREARQIDPEVRDWLAEAYTLAGEPPRSETTPQRSMGPGSRKG